jgi:Na+/proline symporter
MGALSIVYWVVCATYLGIVLGLAVKSVRGQRTNEEYYIGSRRMNWWVVGISMFATSFSSISFLGLPQRGACQDLPIGICFFGGVSLSRRIRGEKLEERGLVDRWGQNP